MGKPTPGKLTAHRYGELLQHSALYSDVPSKDGDDVCVADDISTFADAQRLAACWNACIGFDNPQTLRDIFEKALDILEDLTEILDTAGEHECEIDDTVTQPAKEIIQEIRGGTANWRRRRSRSIRSMIASDLIDTPDQAGFTCDECESKDDCIFAFDPYCTNGDCLQLK